MGEFMKASEARKIARDVYNKELFSIQEERRKADQEARERAERIYLDEIGRIKEIVEIRAKQGKLTYQESCSNPYLMDKIRDYFKSMEYSVYTSLNSFTISWEHA